MSMLCVINGYGGMQETFDRHMPFWQSHGLPILVNTPANDPLTSKHPRIVFGYSSYCGPYTPPRWINLFNELVKKPHSHFVIFEYDSLCLLKKIKPTNGWRGIACHNSDFRKFLSGRYAMAPWVVDKQSLFLMLSAFNRYPDCLEHGSDDRFCAALAMIAGVPILNHTEGVFTDNTIMPSRFPELAHCIEHHDVRWIHGVKCQGCVDTIMKAWGLPK